MIEKETFIKFALNELLGKIHPIVIEYAWVFDEGIEDDEIEEEVEVYRFMGHKKYKSYCADVDTMFDNILNKVKTEVYDTYGAISKGHIELLLSGLGSIATNTNHVLNSTYKLDVENRCIRFPSISIDFNELNTSIDEDYLDDKEVIEDVLLMCRNHFLYLVGGLIKLKSEIEYFHQKHTLVNLTKSENSVNQGDNTTYLTEEVKELIRKADLENLFDILREMDLSKTLEAQLLGLEASHSALQKEYRGNRISFPELTIHQNKIINGLIQILNDSVQTSE